MLIKTNEELLTFHSSQARVIFLHFPFFISIQRSQNYWKIMWYPNIFEMIYSSMQEKLSGHHTDGL